MTDMPGQNITNKQSAFSVGLKKRYAAERRFRAYGLGAILAAISILVMLLSSIVVQGLPAFFQTYIQVDVHFDEAIIDPAGTRDLATLSTANYQALAKRGLYDLFPDVTERREIGRASCRERV